MGHYTASMKRGRGIAERMGECRQVKRLSYLQDHADAERRLRMGQKQRQCLCCGLWLWVDEWNVHQA